MANLKKKIRKLKRENEEYLSMINEDRSKSISQYNCLNDIDTILISNKDNCLHLIKQRMGLYRYANADA